ncbi:MAG: outer membrane lipoprotein-sorting protein [Armatimonadetes bacterium]|nr:outer membrane lipoprotein-sorting protein [Armatimonadota bacterium]
MRRHWLLQTGAAWALMACGSDAFAALSGTEVMTRAEQREVGKDETSQITMKVTARGQQRVKKMRLLRQGKASTKKVLIHFLSPADERGVGFLVWRHKDRDDDRWFYLPALKMVRRIAAADKRSSFVGSDFTYEDVAGRDADRDTHTLTGEKTVDGQPCYVVKSVPKDRAEFASKTAWVRKDSFVIVQEKYYDKQGKLLKTYTADKLEKVQGLWTIRQQTMKNAATGGQTVVTWNSVKYNTGLGEDVFTERYLKRSP